MRCGSDIGKQCVAAELDGKGLEGVSPDSHRVYTIDKQSRMISPADLSWPLELMPPTGVGFVEADCADDEEEGFGQQLSHVRFISHRWSWTGIVQSQCRVGTV